MTVTALPITPVRTIVETEPAVIPYGGPKGTLTNKILAVLYSDDTTGFKCAECDFEADVYGSVFAHRRIHGPTNAAGTALAQARRLVKAAEQAKKTKTHTTTSPGTAPAAPVADATAAFEALSPQQRLTVLAAQQAAIEAEIRTAEEAAAAAKVEATGNHFAGEGTPTEVLVRRVATLERRCAKWQSRALTAEAKISRYENAAKNLAELAT